MLTLCLIHLTDPRYQILGSEAEPHPTPFSSVYFTSRWLIVCLIHLTDCNHILFLDITYWGGGGGAEPHPTPFSSVDFTSRFLIVCWTLFTDCNHILFLDIRYWGVELSSTQNPSFPLISSHAVPRFIMSGIGYCYNHPQFNSQNSQFRVTDEARRAKYISRILNLFLHFTFLIRASNVAKT